MDISEQSCVTPTKVAMRHRQNNHASAQHIRRCIEMTMHPSISLWTDSKAQFMYVQSHNVCAEEHIGGMKVEQKQAPKTRGWHCKCSIVRGYKVLHVGQHTIASCTALHLDDWQQLAVQASAPGKAVTKAAIQHVSATTHVGMCWQGVENRM